MKLTRIVNQGYQPLRKMWVATAIGAAASLASGLIGGSASAKARRKAERMLDQQKAKEDAWYNRNYYQDYADTAAGQNLIRRANEFAKQNWRKAAGAQAVAGGTDAATQMAKDAGNRLVGDTLANVAATDQARKTNVDRQHLQNQNQYTQMEIANEHQHAANIAQVASAASNAIMQGASAFEGGTDLKGGNNKGTEATTSAEDALKFAQSEKLDALQSHGW